MPAIVPFRPGLAPAFAELNRAWIERRFRMEDADRKVLDHPEESIIRPGGQIFLETNSSLANAIRLYERLGFEHATPPHASDYARADVYMELRLRPAVVL